MLKLKYLFENYELAKEALENWRHDEDSLDEMLRYFRISSNAIYPYKNEGKVCFLRLSPLEEKRENNLTGELEFLDYLKKEGYPALEAIPSRGNQMLLTLKTQWGDYYACAFRRVEGVSIDETDMSEEIMLEYGGALARLHNLSENYSPKVKKWNYSDVLGTIKDILIEYKAPEFTFRELEDVEKELSHLVKNKKNYGLVHYDFEPDNVFYDTSSKRCWAIDFEDGMYHWYILDVEQVLGSLEDEVENPQKAQEAKRNFLRGYEAIRPLDKDTVMLFPLMRRFIELYGYARLLRSIAEVFEDEPEWLTALRGKLNGVIKRKEEVMKKAHS